MEIYMVKILDISEKKLNFICSLIDTQKRQVIEKFLNKKDKIRSLVGEILVRTIITQKLNISNRDIVFGKNQYGKPYLIDYPTSNLIFLILGALWYVLLIINL